MRKTFVAVCAMGLAATCLAGMAFAQGKNSNAKAYLSWSSSNTTSTDLTTPGAANSLFIRFEGVEEFKGAEIDLIWDPIGNLDTDANCFAQNGVFQSTSSGTSCTYLNRGTSVPVTTIDINGHHHVAWASDTANTSCTAGNAARIIFNFEGCLDVPIVGCFKLTQALILDGANAVKTLPIMGEFATVNGGGDRCAGLTPVEPATWGTIKSLWR